MVLGEGEEPLGAEGGGERGGGGDLPGRSCHWTRDPPGQPFPKYKVAWWSQLHTWAPLLLWGLGPLPGRIGLGGADRSPLGT